MEKPFNEKKDMLKQWMQELPLESPSSDFTTKVMGQIHGKSLITEYKPLISKTAWVIIGLLIIGAVLWLYFNPSSNMIPEEQLSILDGLQFKNPFEALQLSRTSLYAIAFLALFIVQIPFLKRVVEKNYIQ